jgi:hypothetical protein
MFINLLSGEELLDMVEVEGKKLNMLKMTSLCTRRGHDT